MKSIVLLFCSFVLMSAVSPDPQWKVSHNGKTRLTSSEENEEKNIIAIKAAELKKTGFLQVVYTNQDQQSGWSTHYVVVDAQDNELLNAKGKALKVQNTKLRPLLTKGRTLRIFAWSLPDDPELAARIRVRRIHLATIRLS